MSPKLGLLDKLQPLLLILSIGIGLLLAAALPAFAGDLGPVVPAGIFALIYMVMLGVELAGLARALRNLRFVMLVVVINFVLNPLLAWGLGFLFLQDAPNVWVGLILFLLAPCLGWFLIFTEIARGDVRMGVSLIPLNIFLPILLMPAYMQLLAGQIVTIELGQIVKSVILYLIAPLTLATLSRWALRSSGRQVDELTERLRLPYLKTAALMVVIVAMFASQGRILFANPEVVLLMIPPVLAFFTLAFVIALVVGQLLRLAYEEVALLVFTTTARNSEASLAIAATAFASPLVALTVVIGPGLELPMLIVMARVLLWLRSQDLYPKQAPQPALGGES
jgi:ACR3 family arsenite transporter